MKRKVLAWWSGGCPSAVACYWALQTFKDVEIVFIDTNNEDDDTYRFKRECEKVYGVKITSISNEKYGDITEVWDAFQSLATAHGAICSTELKRTVRVKYQNIDTDYAQVFGFDASEKERHNNMRKNYPEINCISPCLENKISKEESIKIVRSWGVEIPNMYLRGFRNNNCWKTLCVKGGIGYWQKAKREYPDKVKAMAEREHRYTALKGEPVTALTIRRNGERYPLFLEKHPDYEYCLDMAKGREPKPLTECNGFCNTTPLEDLEEL